MLNVVVLKMPYFDEYETLMAKMQAVAPDLSVTVAEGKELIGETLENTEVIFGWPSRKAIRMAKNLKWLHVPSAGVDGYTDKSLYCRSEVRLTNSSGVYGVSIAEHVMGMILSFNRNLPQYVLLKEQKTWGSSGNMRVIAGTTTGIIGLGDIGTEVAARIKAFGGRVLAVKRSPGVKPDFVDELYGEDGMEHVLENSDYVVLALPNTEKTRGILSRERLARMKNSAFLVNVGRGSAIDQEALVDALREGRIAGAGLDVTDPEPLPSDSPLWELPNVILTPHVSGLFPGLAETVAKAFLDNFNRYVTGQPLLNRVDFDRQY